MTKRTKAKGNQFEIAVCRELANAGYHVWRPMPARFTSRRFGSGNDIFNVFDVIASNKDEIKLIQCKVSPAFRKAVIAEIEAVIVPENVSKEYWILVEKKNEVRKRII